MDHELFSLMYAQVRAVIIPEEAREEARVEELNQEDDQTVLNEDVFVSQLHRRARVLNSEFQAKILDVVSR